MADTRTALLDQARARSGRTYRLDPPPSASDGTIDCSLLILEAAKAAGIPLPPGVRTAEQIRWASLPVPWDEVRPGDLLFFEGTYDAGPPSSDGHIASHIGFSLGAGTQRMIDAHTRAGPDVAETDISSDDWQSLLFEARRLPGLVMEAPEPVPSTADPWQFFSPDMIVRATSADMGHVQQHWPRIVEQLRLAGINDRATQIAALATIDVEVGDRFEPIHEYGTPANWTGYSGGSGFAGRGFIQLTHDYNYRTYSQKLDELWGDGAPDLLANPDDALDPGVAAAVLALYFRDHGIPAMAAAGNWQSVRKAVNGGLTGWDTFNRAVDALSGMSAPIPAPAPPPVPVPPVPTPSITRADLDAALAPLLSLRERLPA